MIALLDEYPKCFLVGADNVSSKQMQQIRGSMRGVGVVLMGKNTMMRKAIRGHMNNNPDLERLLPHIKGNTGLGPEKTSFFQALAIPTKISRGTIEIINDVK